METSTGSVSPGRGETEGSKATQFKPGHSGPRRGTGRKSRQPSRLLRDMRFVYEHDEAKDWTPGQKLCRQMLKDDPKGFLSQLAKLETGHQAGSAREKAVQPMPPTQPVEAVRDIGSERALQLIEELFKSFEEEEAKRGAPGR